jgi:uncharacterized protein with HEPN domain
MPERKPSAILDDILNCIEHIQSYTSALSFEQFSSHFMTVEACLYNLQVIGEAVSILPQNIKEENEHIQWAAIKGMRNRLIHEYFGTDLQLVWSVIQDGLPELKIKLQELHAFLLQQNK